MHIVQQEQSVPVEVPLDVIVEDRARGGKFLFGEEQKKKDENCKCEEEPGRRS